MVPMTARQTWAMLCPPQPGPEVLAVTDKQGDLWRRTEHDTWRWTGRRGVLHVDEFWRALVREWGPLTDATPDDVRASAPGAAGGPAARGAGQVAAGTSPPAATTPQLST